MFTARKKPVEIQAEGPFYEQDEISTLEGDYEVDEEYLEIGYYIITGVQGEKYPCRKDIFHDTYEIVE